MPLGNSPKENLKSSPMKSQWASQKAHEETMWVLWPLPTHFSWSLGVFGPDHRKKQMSKLNTETWQGPHMSWPAHSEGHGWRGSRCPNWRAPASFSLHHCHSTHWQLGMLTPTQGGVLRDQGLNDPDLGGPPPFLPFIFPSFQAPRPGWSAKPLHSLAPTLQPWGTAWSE